MNILTRTVLLLSLLVTSTSYFNLLLCIDAASVDDKGRNEYMLMENQESQHISQSSSSLMPSSSHPSLPLVRSQGDVLSSTFINIASLLRELLGMPLFSTYIAPYPFIPTDCEPYVYTFYTLKCFHGLSLHPIPSSDEIDNVFLKYLDLEDEWEVTRQKVMFGAIKGIGKLINGRTRIASTTEALVLAEKLPEMLEHALKAPRIATSPIISLIQRDRFLKEQVLFPLRKHYHLKMRKFLGMPLHSELGIEDKYDPELMLQFHTLELYTKGEHSPHPTRKLFDNYTDKIIADAAQMLKVNYQSLLPCKRDVFYKYIIILRFGRQYSQIHEYDIIVDLLESWKIVKSSLERGKKMPNVFGRFMDEGYSRATWVHVEEWFGVIKAREFIKNDVQINKTLKMAGEVLKTSGLKKKVTRTAKNRDTLPQVDSVVINRSKDISAFHPYKRPQVTEKQTRFPITNNEKSIESSASQSTVPNSSAETTPEQSYGSQSTYISQPNVYSNFQTSRSVPRTFSAYHWS